MTLDPIFGRISSGRPGVLLYQLPTVLAFGLALVSLPFADTVTDGRWVAAGFVVITLVSLAALVVPWAIVGLRWAVLVPLLSLGAVGCLRIGTGGTGSPYSAILLLPFVWLALEPGRVNALLATVGMFVVSLLPPLLGSDLRTSGDVVKAVIAPVVYALVALVLNEIARRLRVQLARATENVRQREVLLEEAVRASQEARRNEARADAATQLFTGIWEAVTEQSIIGTDLEGRIDSWNPGARNLLGLTQHDVLEAGRSVTEFHLPQEIDVRLRGMLPDHRGEAGPFCALVRDVAAGSADVREWVYVRPDGSQVPVQVAATPRLDDAGTIIGYLFVATDLTKAVEFARLKDEFVGMISHELRTPLSSIMGYLELLRDEEDGPLTPEQVQYLDVAERNAQRLLRLVGDLLFTAQVDAGQFPLDLQDTVLDDVLVAAVESARPAAARTGIDLRLVTEDAPVVIRGDAVRLGQALDNLLSNALKYSTSGGAVTVSLERADECVVLTVRDTGIGIPDDELGHLTTRFFRASTATSSSVPGIGLGLAITKAIVTAHRGRIDITSQVGAGTAFVIELPATATQPAAVTAG